MDFENKYHEENIKKIEEFIKNFPDETDQDKLDASKEDLQTELELNRVANKVLKKAEESKNKRVYFNCDDVILLAEEVLNLTALNLDKPEDNG